jgi:RecB family endonuclease NucS
MRLIVAKCSATYTGRLTTQLAEAVRLLMLKADGTFMIWADGGGNSVKPLNWMTPPTVIEHEGEPPERIVVRKRAGKTEDRLEIRIVEILSDVEHEMGEAAALAKDGVERDLQLELAGRPDVLGEGLHLVEREWQTDIGPVDLMCRDRDGAWVAVEVKRIATIEAVEQLSRYLERIQTLPGMAACRGILAGQRVVKQARTLAESRGLGWVEVDLASLRGEREPELTLFSG